MKAVIMAGGEGTRLRPLTCGIPKPMVPILGRPVMEYTVELLKKYGINDVAVTMAYHPAVITDYFGDGRSFDVNFNYFTEETPLGTGGSVKNAEVFLKDTFIIVSGDALTDLDIEKAIQFHKEKGSKATLVLKKVDVPLEYGVVITDDNGRIIRFLEKPSWGEVFSDTINTGIYILEPEVLDYYKKGDVFDFSKDLFPKLLDDRVPMYGYVTEAYWNDIGDLQVYKEVNFDILMGKVKVEIPFDKKGADIWIGRDVEIDQSIQLIPPVVIGDHCVIGKGSVICNSVLGSHVNLGMNNSLKNCILWDNVYLENRSECKGAVLCNNVIAKSGVHIYENAVVGKSTVIANDAVIKPEIKIWPDKTIEENAVVNRNLVWGTKAVKTLFGFRDISGYVNTDLSPEFASRLGSAFGSTLKMQGKVVVSGDGENASQMLKDSLLSGLASTGVQVLDLEKTIMPMNRFAVKFYKAEGGIHIRKDMYEENRLHIEFVNRHGINLSRAEERKVENLFAREDYQRCSADHVKPTMRVDNFASFYVQEGANQLANLDKIKNHHPRILLASESEHVLLLAAYFLENIGCKVDVEYSHIMSQGPSHMEGGLGQFAENVVRQGAAIGMYFAGDGENLLLVDHQGNIFDQDKYRTLAALILAKQGAAGQRVVLPYNASRTIDKLMADYGVEIKRTRNQPSEILSAIEQDSPSNLQYILNFDAIWASGCLIDFLVGTEISLNDLFVELPEFFMRKIEIPCDWRYKGTVMREIIEENKNNEIELFEGVKIENDKGWVLVLPDSEKPVCNLYVEGLNEEFSRELTDIYENRIRKIVKNAQNRALDRNP